MAYVSFCLVFWAFGEAETRAPSMQFFHLVPKLYLGMKMIAKFNLAVKKAFPSSAWEREQNYEMFSGRKIMLISH